MKHILDYEIKDKNDDKFKLNAYASYCISYIEQLKDKIDLKSEEVEVKGKKYIRYSADMIKVVKKIPKILPSKTTKKASGKYLGGDK